MEFCTECGMRLVLNQNKMDNEIRHFFICPKCSFKKEATNKVSPLSRTSEHSTLERIAVIDGKSAKLRTLPKTKTECAKCSNKEAFWWMVQTRGADESPTQFFRCTKCMYTWREMA